MFPCLLSNVQAAIPDVVANTGRIFVERKEGDTWKWYRGTFWVISRNNTDAYIVTAGHIVPPNKSHRSVILEFFYPSRFTVRGTVVFSIYDLEDYTKDVAVIKISSKDLPRELDGLPLATASFKFKNDFNIITHGCANGYWPSMLFGKIVGQNFNLYRIDAETHPGRSGSPVLDETGSYIIGMHVREGGYFLSVTDIVKILKEKGYLA